MAISKLLPICLVAALPIHQFCAPSATKDSTSPSLPNVFDQLFDPTAVAIPTNPLLSSLEQTKSHLRAAITMNNIETVKQLLEYTNISEEFKQRIANIFCASSIIDLRLQDATYGLRQISKSGALLLDILICNNDISTIDIGYLLGHEELTRSLIAWKLANINDYTKSICNNEPKIIDCLFSENGLDINAKDNNGDTILHFACTKDQPKLVKLLLANPTVQINLQNNHGNTALMEALHWEHLAFINDFLFRKDLNLNIQSNLKSTLLHIACCRYQLEPIMALLADSRVDVNLGNDLGNTAMMEIINRGHVNVVSTFLLRKELDFTIQNNRGDTILHLACHANQPKAVEMLLSDPRINVNLQNNKGNTGIMEAANKGYLDIVRILLASNNLNTSIKNRNGNTLLHIACRRNHLEIVKILLAHNEKLTTALTKIIVKILLEQSMTYDQAYSQRIFDINAQNNSGFTPLHYACTFKHRKLVKVLLGSPEININLQDQYGHVAIMQAIQRKNFNIVKLFSFRKDFNLSVKNTDDNSL